nr:hypothetical protein StreXyl84_07300 [Streptomyces sp. Xyl84]
MPTAAAVPARTRAWGRGGAPPAGNRNVGAAAPAAGSGGHGAGDRAGSADAVADVVADAPDAGAAATDGPAATDGLAGSGGRPGVTNHSGPGKALTDGAATALCRCDRDTARPPASRGNGDRATARALAPAPLSFSRSCKRAAGLRARHDCCPLSIG